MTPEQSRAADLAFRSFFTWWPICMAIAGLCAGLAAALTTIH